MTVSAKLNDINIEYDKQKTTEAYVNEISIKEDCPCDDCAYFVDVVLKIDLEIFRILKSIGTDLEKNLKNEPTGVWCIRNDDDEFIFFQQVYRIEGFLHGKLSYHYEKEEQGLKVDAVFVNHHDHISVDLQVARIGIV